MATSKRERQRANRDARKVEEEKQEKRDLLMSRIKRGALWVLLLVALLFAANLVFGGNGDDDATDTTVTETTSPDTTSPDTTSPDTTSPDTTSPDTTEPQTTTTEAAGFLTLV